MALSDYVIAWLKECDDSADRVELYVISSRVFDKLRERNAMQEEIDQVFRSLAPLEFHERHAATSPWNCFFAPKIESEEGRAEFPNLAQLNSQNVDEWANLAKSLKRPNLKARFADAVWELGKRLGSARKDLYRFGRLASESYLEMGASESKDPLALLNAVSRGIQLATQLGASDLVDRGYEFLMQYSDSVEQTHVGLWSAPFDRLLRLNGLSEAQKSRILEHHAQRFDATVASGDIFRLEVIGPSFAKYFHDRRQYQRAKEITFAYGEAILKSAASLNASLATHHIEGVLEAYRRVGLKEETDRVRLHINIARRLDARVAQGPLSILERAVVLQIGSQRSSHDLERDEALRDLQLLGDRANPPPEEVLPPARHRLSFPLSAPEGWEHQSFW